MNDDLYNQAALLIKECRRLELWLMAIAAADDLECAVDPEFCKRLASRALRTEEYPEAYMEMMEDDDDL